MDELDALERLVRRYSPSGSEASAVREFLRIAASMGYATRRDAAGNGIARRGRGRPRVLFLGHIDTVEGRRPVRRQRGSLWGRGTVDAKGPLVAALFAGRDHAGPGELRVVAAVGEETNSAGARHLARQPPPDGIIVGEPSGWNGVTIGYKGEARLEATFRGDRSHFSSPHPTAAGRAVSWAHGLESLAAAHQGPSPFRSLSVKTLDFRSERAGGKETARVTVDARLPPGISTAELLRTIRRAPDRPSLQVTIRVEPVEVARSNPVVRALIEGIRRQRGEPTLFRKCGTSDLNVVAPAWRVPSAVYGPGDARWDHTDHERVSARELRRSVDVLRSALGELSSTLINKYPAVGSRAYGS